MRGWASETPIQLLYKYLSTHSVLERIRKAKGSGDVKFQEWNKSRCKKKKSQTSEIPDSSKEFTESLSAVHQFIPSPFIFSYTVYLCVCYCVSASHHFLLFTSPSLSLPLVFFVHFSLCLDTGPIISTRYCPNPNNSHSLFVRLHIFFVGLDAGRGFSAWKGFIEQSEQM